MTEVHPERIDIPAVHGTGEQIHTAYVECLADERRASIQANAPSSRIATRPELGNSE